MYSNKLIIFLAFAMCTLNSCLELEPYQGVYIHGRINDIKTSNNHSFGIYFIDIDSMNIPDDILKSNKFLPFRINNTRGEVYLTVSIEDSVGQYLTLVGDSNLVIIKNQSGHIISKGLITDVQEGINRNFISENSKLN